MAGKNIKFLEKSPVKLNFTKKLMTPYGGFALVAKLFEKLELKEHIEQLFPVVETSPNGTGIYAKVLRFGLTVLAGGKRLSHGLFLAGSEPVQAALFGVKRLPSSSSALTRFFRVSVVGKRARRWPRDCGGIGIAADQLVRIFDMFIQVDTSLERTQSGLGIGLTLAKNLVELHGGTLEAYSAGIGQGSEFVVRLPIVVEAPKLAQPMPDVSALTTMTIHRILVVDDNRDSAEFLSTLLDLNGYEAHTANDGLEAIEAAATFRPDLILLDIGLPKLNGYDVARKIREQPWGRDIVLVARPDGVRNRTVAIAKKRVLITI